MSAFCRKIRLECVAFKNNIQDFDKKQDIYKEGKRQPPVDDQFAFFLNLLKVNIGFGQIWRFPTLLYGSGGAAFAYMYVFWLLTITNAVFYLEIALGQYSSRTTVTIFEMIPAARGLGFSFVISGIFLISYYNQIVAFAIYYLFNSLSYPLPWSICGRRKNRGDTICSTNCTGFENCEYPSYFFWNTNMAQIEKNRKDGQDNSASWSLILCSSVAWILVYLSLIQKPSYNKKLPFFVLIISFTMMLILTYAAFTTPGSFEGLLEMLSPRWSDFLNIESWILALELSLYSVGAGTICSSTLGKDAVQSAYSHIDCNLVMLFIMIYSLLCGATAFGIIQLMATKNKQTFHEAIVHDNYFIYRGPTILFVAFPEALTYLPLSPFFSFLFFLTLVFMGVTTVSSIARSIVLGLAETSSFARNHRYLLNFLLVLGCFILGAPMLTRGGLFYFHILEFFPAGFAVLFLCAAEVFTVIFFYGIRRFCEDIEFMTGRYPSRYYRYLWLISGFVFLIAFLASFNCVQQYAKYYSGTWAFHFGLSFYILTLLPFFVVLLLIFIRFYRKRNWKECFRVNPNYGPKLDYLNQKRKKFKSKRSLW